MRMGISSFEILERCYARSSKNLTTAPENSSSFLHVVWSMRALDSMQSHRIETISHLVIGRLLNHFPN